MELSLTLDEIETNLRVLGDIKENEKLVIDGNFIKVDDRYLSSFRRWWSEDNRNLIIVFLSSIINHCKKYYIDMVTIIKNGDNNCKETYNRLSTFTMLIEKSRDGLHNLALTYNSDKLIRARMECLKRQLNYLVSEFINTGNQYYN